MNASEAIQQGLADMQAGSLAPHDDVMAEARRIIRETLQRAEAVVGRRIELALV